MIDITEIHKNSAAFAGRNERTGAIGTARGFRAVIAALAFLLLAAASQAGDDGRYGHVSHGIKEWIHSLTNDDGIGCCAMADGIRPEAVGWDVAMDAYVVKVDGQWLLVPDDTVLRGVNRLGHPMVWLENGGDLDVAHDTPLVRCFLPGAMS